MDANKDMEKQSVLGTFKCKSKSVAMKGKLNTEWLLKYEWLINDSKTNAMNLLIKDNFK